jgi:hypothetical protein
MLNIDCLCSTCQVCQMTKKERKKYGLLLPKIAESDMLSLGHGLCVSGGYLPFTIRTPAKSHSLLALSHKHNTGCFEIVEATNKSATSVSIPDLFITPGLHVIRDLNSFSLIIGMKDNSIVSSKKCVTIMALKPNQLQVTTYQPQANAIIARVHKVVNDMHRSFDLENNHENLEEQEDYPFDYFFQSTAWSPCY